MGGGQPLVALRSVPGSQGVRDTPTSGEHGRRGRSEPAHQSKGQMLGAECVSNVGSPVLNCTLTGHDGPDEVAQHGEHGQTSFLDLLDLQRGETVRIVSQT